MINLVRGALIGVAEVIPGVSGGTVALIVGIYRTLINAVEIGLVADLYLSNVEPATNPVLRVVLMLGGIVVTGIGSGIYIGAGLGPGPRDGLMTGLAARGMRVSVARTSVEVSIMVIGVILGGAIGIGTLAFALLIGPIVARTLPYFRMRPREAR